MSGDELVRHEKSGPREAFFHGRSVSDRCDVCKLSETIIRNRELQEWIDNYGRHDPECPAHQRQKGTSLQGPCDCGLTALETKADVAPKQAPKCDHGNWIVDGDRDICGKCGSRANPVL